MLQVICELRCFVANLLNDQDMETVYDRTELEYEKDRVWMAEELAALDIEEKLEWVEAENEETQEIGEQRDRLDP